MRLTIADTFCPGETIYQCCDLQTLLTEDKWLVSRWWSKKGAWRWAGLTKEQRRPFTKCSSGEGFRGTGTFWKRPHKAALTNGPQRVRGSLQDISPPSACANCVFRKRQLGGRADLKFVATVATGGRVKFLSAV